MFVLERKSGKYFCILFHFLLIGKLFFKTLVRGTFCLLFWTFPLLKPNLSIFHLLLNKISLVYLLKTGVAEHSCVCALRLGDGSSLSLSPLFCYTPRLFQGARNMWLCQTENKIIFLTLLADYFAGFKQKLA